MSLPFFPMYPTDFEAKTSHLTLAEDGAYNRLLRICWMTPDCTIPADEAWIMRRTRAMSDQEQEAVRTVLTEFFTVENGRYSNARLRREWLAAKEAHTRRKSAGAKGGKAKVLKSNKSDASNAVAKPKQPEPQPEPDIGSGDGSACARDDETSERTSDPNLRCQAEASAPKDHTEREALLLAIGHDPSGLNANGRLIGGLTDMDEKRRWRDDLGLSHDQQLAVIREVMAQRRDGRPPGTFRYFTPAMQRRAGQLTQEPLAPSLALHAGGQREPRRAVGQSRTKTIITAAAVGSTGKDWG